MCPCVGGEDDADDRRMHAWKTIAPVMLPIASVSLPWRTQIRLLNFSGSSVAIGAMTSASRTGRHSQSPSGQVLHRVDEDDRAAEDEQTEPPRTCRLTTRSADPPGSMR